MTSRPLRFLALVLGGWVCLRAALLVPDGWRGAAVNPPAAIAWPRPAEAGPAIAYAKIPAETQPARDMPAGTACCLIRYVSYKTRARLRAGAGPAAVRAPAERSSFAIATAAPTARLFPVAGRSPAAEPAALPTQRRAGGSWTISAWLLVRRDGGGAGLAPGGTLGGSQAGARLSYRLGGGFSLGARAYAALRQPAGAEVAAGIVWRPAAAIPVEILVERRQALGRQGRSAFSIAAQGGRSLALPSGLRLDAYGQAGIVGRRSLDAFIDGAARVSAPVGPVEVGAGLWGAAQPGASRLDAGPTLSWRLPIRGSSLRVAADWRFRLAGEASPGSGPALVLAVDF